MSSRWARRRESPLVLGLIDATVRRRAVYRMLLPQSAQHLYYSVDAKAERVIVHTIWGARRGRVDGMCVTRPG